MKYFKYISIKINKRKQSVIKVVNNQNFTKKLKFLYQNIDIILEEMTKTSINRNNKKVAGW